MLYRALAVLGLPAHLLARAGNGLLGLVGLQLPVVGLVMGGLLVVAGLGAYERWQEFEARPDPRMATVTEIVEEAERGQIIWLRFEAEVAAESHAREVPILTIGAQEIDSFLRYYYLARDPENPAVGLIVRSHHDDDHFRRRAFSAVLTADAAFVEEALDRLDVPPELRVDPIRYLDEVGPAPADADAVAPGALADVDDGAEVVASGRLLSPEVRGACAPAADPGGCQVEDPDARWIYLLADPDPGRSAVVVRSPHAPDAIPVDLQGLMRADTLDLTPVIESGWLAEERAQMRYPQTRVMFDGHSPPFPSIDWSGVVLAGGLALLLGLSRIVGYPVFQRLQPSGGILRLAAGEQLQAELWGELGPGAQGARVQGSSGYVERMTLPELAVTLLRYSQAPPGLSRPEVEALVRAEAGARDDRLVVHVPGRSLLATLDDGVRRIEAGRLHTAGGSLPAVRLKAERLDLTITFEEPDHRDRVVAEVRRAQQVTAL